MKLNLSIAFLFISALSYTQEQEKDLNSDKVSAPAQKEDFCDYWDNLTKYQQEKKFPASTQGENRVVFLGILSLNSGKKISPDFFKGKPT